MRNLPSFRLLFLCLVFPAALNGLEAPAPSPWSAISAWAAASPRNLHSLVVEHRGRMVVELYRHGWDTSLSGGGGVFSWWTNQGPETLHDVRSTTKSVVGLLAGIVLNRHPEVSVNVRIRDFPELARVSTSGALDVTLADLLGMTTGLAWKEWGHPWWDSDELALVTSTEPIRHALNRPRVSAPGTQFVYSGGATQVAARMLELLEGRPLEVLAQTHLWEPLGIPKVQWGRGADGRVLAFAGLGLRTTDLVKLGRLVLEDGRYGGTSVVPPAWISAMTAARTKTDTALFNLDPRGTFYGLGWWNGTWSTSGRTGEWTSTVGNGGQRVFVAPGLGLVVVMTAGDYGDPSIQLFETDLLKRIIEASVLADPAGGSLKS